MSTRKKYTKAFKEEAVRLSESGDKTVGQQAANLGISEAQLHAWRRAAREGREAAFPGKGHARDSELAEWKRRPQQATGAASGDGTGDSKKNCADLCAEYAVNRAMLYGFIEEHEQAYPITVLCEVLEVGASGYYAWRGRPQSERARANEALNARIAQAWEHSRKTYGSPRMTAQLNAQGQGCSENRVARLMAESGLKARKTGRVQPHKTDSAPSGPVAANRLNRAFTASAPNQKWVGDVTFIATHEGEPRRLVVFGRVDGFIQPQDHWLGDE